MDPETYHRALASLRQRLQSMNEILSSDAPSTQTQPEIDIEESAEPIEESSIKAEPTNTTPQFHIFTSKKQQIKQEITAILTTGQQSTVQLKKKIVDIEKKCSKASFYRYIQELKNEQTISILTVNTIEYCVLVKK